MDIKKTDALKYLKDIGGIKFGNMLAIVHRVIKQQKKKNLIICLKVFKIFSN